jgi:hypothetical protein
MESVVITFDHLKLVRRNLTELHRYRRFVLGMTRGEVTEIAIEHEADNRCCKLEPWAVTNAYILSAIMPEGKKTLIIEG